MKPPSWLTTLVDRGAVAHSTANPKILTELITLGIVAIKTVGIRRSVVVAKPEQLRKWLDARYPDHGVVPDAAHVREGNILRSGGSKAGNKAHGVFSFQFKWFGKRNLIDKQKRKALFDEKNRNCLPVIQLIEQHNAGLEQEIVGLPEWTNISP